MDEGMIIPDSAKVDGKAVVPSEVNDSASPEMEHDEQGCYFTH